MAVSGIDYENVGVRPDESFGSLVIVDTDGGTDQEPAPAVPCGYGVLLDAVDISHCNQAGQLALAVDQQKFFHLVLLEDFLGLLEGGSRRACHQVILYHNGAYLGIVIFEKLQIPARQNAYELFALDDRYTGDVLLFHQLLRSSDRLVRR